MVEPTSPQKHCAACAEAIEASARLCKHCRTYQDAWRSRLLFWAQVSGLLAVVLASATFLVTNAGRVRQALCWNDDLNVLAFKSNEYLLVANSGDGAVFLSHASLILDLAPFGKKTITKQLNILVPKGVIQSIPIASGTVRETKYVGTASAQGWQAALGRAFRGDGCVSPILFTTTEPSLVQVKAAHEVKSQSLPTFPAKARFMFYSVHDGKVQSREVSVLGALTFSDAPECSATQ